MVRSIVVLLLALLATNTVVISDDGGLDTYIRQGLDGNLALQRENLELDKSLAALQEARGLFLPALTLEARYSRAGGGRTIDFPIGSLINPIHQSLNALLQQNVFPANLQDDQINFLREEEHDTRLRLVQPLFNARILQNYRVRDRQAAAQEAARNTYARQLIADIETAWFSYRQTQQVVQLLTETEMLLDENLRVSQSLFDNQKATEEVVFRARAELSALKQQRAEADRNAALAKSYFNFLLNRPLESAIEIGDEAALVNEDLSLEAATARALERRDELQQLAFGVEAASRAVTLNRAAFLPELNLVADYGFQGEKYNFGSDDDYWMVSGILSWNLFNGFQDKARVQQAKLAADQLSTRRQELEQQIRLQSEEAWRNLEVARASSAAAADRLQSARKSFDIIERKYREGISPQIEYLDARNTLTAAGINDIVVRYDFRIRLAQFRQITAAVDLDQYLTSKTQ